MKKKLKSAIRECLNDAATYVYVTFRHIFVEKKSNYYDWFT